MHESLWACHLWIWSSKLIVGPASSSLWTENLKPRDSWAGVWRKREEVQKPCEGRREEDEKIRDKMRCMLTSKVASCLNRLVLKCLLTLYTLVTVHRQRISHVRRDESQTHFNATV